MALFKHTDEAEAPAIQSELAHVAEEMYKRNHELAERNKTLQLLRQIDEIVLSAVTDPPAVAQKMADAIVNETDFGVVAIYLFDHGHHNLVPLAVSLRGMTPLAVAVKGEIMSQNLRFKSNGEVFTKAIKQKSSESTNNLADIVSGGLNEQELKQIQAAMNAKAMFLCPLIVRGKPLGLMIIGSPVAKSELSEYRKNLIDRLAGVVGIAIDNSLLYQELDDATKRLRKANENLKALDKTKDEFLSMASHQLRTPLTTIKGYISMLAEGDAGALNPQQKEFLNYALEGSMRMVGLISDLLNVSRMSSGKFIIDKSPVDVCEMVSDEVRQLQTHAAQKNLKLEFVPPKVKPPVMQIDEGKTRQVVMNFIDNAIYYTKQGSVTVTVESDAKAVRVLVKDTGIGVPPDAKAKLFTKFFRADNAQATRPDGTGLGLYLAKRVVEDQGGKIIFDSEVGKGSTFGFELPLPAKGSHAADIKPK